MARQDPERERLRSADSQNNLEGRSLWAGSLCTLPTSWSLEPKVTLGPGHIHPPLPQRPQSGHQGLCKALPKPSSAAHCCTPSCQGHEPGAGQQDLGSGRQPVGRGKPSRSQSHSCFFRSLPERGSRHSLGTISGRHPVSLPRAQPGCPALRGGFAGWAGQRPRGHSRKAGRCGRPLGRSPARQAAPTLRGWAAGGGLSLAAPAS